MALLSLLALLALLSLLSLLALLFLLAAHLFGQCHRVQERLVCHLLLSGNVRGRLAHLFLGLGKLGLGLLECGGCLHGLR